MYGFKTIRLYLPAASLAFMIACSANRESTDLPGPHTGLAGTGWRLVEIVSMDDRVYMPDERSRYTLEILADGSMRLRADCNYGTGSWTSAYPGQLLFGEIAATRALCPPGSLHDRYLAQFQWVRSYVMKDGHLYLATMADGSISEFEPIPGN